MVDVNVGGRAPLKLNVTYSRQTEAVLREMVLDGTLTPGERLNEVALSAALGISRGPLREAIQKLVGEGLLRVQSHRGAYVREYEPREIIELYEMRAALELYAVRLAVERASDTDLERVHNILLQSSDSPGHQPQPGPYVAELDFHQQLVELAGNSIISANCLEMNRRLYPPLSRTPRDPQRVQNAVAEHQRVMTALRSRSRAGASAAMEQHLANSMRNSLVVLGLETVTLES
ncbi:GntR family transcriptional regulator [Glaciibacter superstes]|uniref:GntR family transcriptional regulator n=1 Tax=Glaciibacter superstes TaxID=501023 RepID=UPI0003B5CC50|nr:GntR family transcriptional regulator [Glaciibacter superstes]